MAKMRNKLFVLTLLLLILLTGASFVLAQEKPLEVVYPTVPGAATPIDTKTPLPDYVKYVFNLSLMLAGVIALAATVYGGTRYLTSAGSPARISDAKSQIFAGLLGLIILLSSYVILNTLNPKLLFFNITLPDLGEPMAVPPPPLPLEEQTLYATEIPVAELIDGIGPAATGGSTSSPAYLYEGVLAKTRLARITKLSEDIWKTSKDTTELSAEIKEAAEEIKRLTDQCSCGRCNPVGCNGCGDCGPCGCQGDPCPNRGAIQEQQALINAKAQKLPPLQIKLKTLRETWQLEQKKLENALAELEKAERLMKECPSSVSEQRNANILLTASDFFNYKEGLVAEQVIKAMEIQKVWEHISAENDEATFYCAETPFEVSLIEGTVSETEINELLPQVENAEEPKVLCETIIPMGQALDNSEDIAERAIEEMKKVAEESQKIIDEIPKEKSNAEYLAVLPDSCLCSNCACSCIADCCCSCDDEGNCCSCYCYPTPCQGLCCPFAEIAATLQRIIENHEKITASYDKITASDDEIHNLINGDEIHNKELIDSDREPTWAYNIINEELPSIRIEFGGCRNRASEWTDSLSGENILTKSILTCEDGRSACRDIEQDYECHGEDDPDAYPDYFCAEAEIK